MNEKTQKKQFITFTVLYLTGVNLSILIMPLYFNQNHAVKNYGMAYASMSFAGIFSIFLGKIVDKFSWIKILSISTLIYAGTIIGRTVTSEYFACVNAFILGLAASIGVLSIKNWMIQSTEAKITNQLVLYRSLIFHSTNLFAMIFSYFMVYIKIDKEVLYFVLLILSGFFVLSAWIYFLVIKSNYQIPQKEDKVLSKLKSNKVITLLAISMLFSGCYSGLIKPYLILLFIKKGFSDQNSIFINLLIVFSQVLFTSFVLKKLDFFSKAPLKMLTYLELSIFLIYLFLYFEYAEIGIFILLFFFILRTFILSTSACTEEILHIELVPKAQFSAVFGLLLTMFLVGDSLGSFISSFIYNHHYLNIFLISSIFALLNLFTYISLNFLIKKHHRIAQ